MHPAPPHTRKGDGRLTVDGLYALIRRTGQGCGYEKPMSPHRMRHTSITAALDATDGNVRAVQKLSRHAKIDTLLVYDDARQKQQKVISELLSSTA
jgi:integrase/recombinase XerC